MVNKQGKSFSPQEFQKYPWRFAEQDKNFEFKTAIIVLTFNHTDCFVSQPSYSGLSTSYIIFVVGSMYGGRMVL